MEAQLTKGEVKIDFIIIGTGCDKTMTTHQYIEYQNTNFEGNASQIVEIPYFGPPLLLRYECIESKLCDTILVLYMNDSYNFCGCLFHHVALTPIEFLTNSTQELAAEGICWNTDLIMLGKYNNSFSINGIAAQVIFCTAWCVKMHKPPSIISPL